VQQVELDADRALKIPLSSLPTTSTELPVPSANKLLAWNSNASAVTNFDPASVISIVGQQASFSNVFTGNGVTVNFTLDRTPGNANAVDVSINGVTQVPNVDYILNGDILTFTTAPPQVASQILARYTEVFAEPNGDAANVRYTPAGSGAVVTNVQAKLRETVSVKDFGAVGDGVTDDTVAIQAAINTGKSVVFPEAIYLANNLTQSTNNQTFVGIGRPTIKKNANGMLLTASGRDWAASNILFDARTGGYTGGGILGTADVQQLNFCGVRTLSGYAVELHGSASKIIGTNDIYFTDDAAAGPIKIGDNSLPNAQYISIIGINKSTSAGNLLVENAGNVWITSCQTKNILCTTGAAQVASCRVVGDLTFYAGFSSVSNSLIAGNLTLGDGINVVSSIRVAPDVQVISTGVITINALIRESVIHVAQMATNTIVDNLTGTAGDIDNVFYGKPTSYTPVWGGGDGTQSIGNGTLQASYVRKGRTVQVIFDMQMGSTTTYGTGSAAYTFSLPTTTRNLGYPYYGIGELFQTTARLGVLRAQSNSNVFEFINEGYAGPMRYNRPETWASGQRARGQIEYVTA